MLYPRSHAAAKATEAYTLRQDLAAARGRISALESQLQALRQEHAELKRHKEESVRLGAHYRAERTAAYGDHASLCIAANKAIATLTEQLSALSSGTRAYIEVLSPDTAIHATTPTAPQEDGLHNEDH